VSRRFHTSKGEEGPKMADIISNHKASALDTAPGVDAPNIPLSRALETILETLLSISDSISHEMKDPVTSILGNTQLLLRHSTICDPAALGRLKAIECDALHVKTIIERLSTVNHPPSPSPPKQPRFFDLETIPQSGETRANE
jgi:signal transduction histidine kinase